MMKKIIFSAFLTLVAISGNAQSNVAAKEVKWYTIQEAEKLNSQSPRPLFIDAYTDWCGWCKKMDKDTFTNPVISELLNTRFYPVKFNAEGKEEIKFLGQSFVNDGKAGNAHQLAVALLNGQLSYPTVVIMNIPTQGQPSASQVPGYKTPKDMEMLLTFFADKAYETKSWDVYQQSFKGKVQ